MPCNNLLLLTKFFQKIVDNWILILCLWYWNDAPFSQEEMQRFVKKIVDLMREEMLFSWQGGPIIMLQVVS